MNFPEDIPILILALIVVVSAACWLYQKRARITEYQAIALYLMYYHGSQDAEEIMDAIEPTTYPIRNMYYDLRYLERVGYVERDKENDDPRATNPQYGYSYMMTDAGEAAYEKYGSRFGLPYEREEGITP